MIHCFCPYKNPKYNKTQPSAISIFLRGKNMAENKPSMPYANLEKYIRNLFRRDLLKKIDIL